MAHWWTNYPWRVIQPNFREIDTIGFDEERFLKELDEFSCNTVMLNAAGLIASYATSLEDQTKSAYIQNFDLRQLVERCHQRGIRVIARTDFSKIARPVFERHPDWAYRHADGTELDYNGYVQTCRSGGYQGGYMDDILKEMLGEIPFDGIYINMGSATGYVMDYSGNRHEPCHCENCRKAFRSRFGLEIPTELRLGEKESLLYFGWQQKLAAEQKKRITKLLRDMSPELAYCSIDYSRQEAHTEFEAGLPHWQYRASSAARAMRGMDVEATVADVDFMGFPYRHVSATPALQELRLWQTLANFSGIDYYVIGRLYDKPDRSAFDRVKRIFRYAKEHEDLMYGVSSVSDVLLVRDSYIIPNKEEWGWVRVLTELHILFDETLPGGLSQKDLSCYKAVILPEKNRLQPQVIDKLNAYAAQGGIVITSGQHSSLVCCGVVERGGEAVFGGSAGEAGAGALSKMIPYSDLLGAMFRFRPEEFSVFPSLSDRTYMIAGRKYLETSFDAETESYGTLLMPERFGPPELCYATQAPTGLPAVTRRPYGKGYGICLPWYPGTNYYVDGHDSWRLFIGDLLRGLCGVKSAGSDLCPMVEVTRGRKGDTEILHLVNGSGHFGNSFFEPPILSGQTVEIPWPYETVTCQNIDDPGNLTYTLENGILKLTVPSLGFHACITVKQQV